MSSYVHAKGRKRGASIPAVINMRKARAKMELFSIKMVGFMSAVFVLASLFFVNSFVKSYKNRQLVSIRTYVDENRQNNFRKSELEANYLKLTSSKIMMRKAEELGLRVATKDKIISLR